MRLKQACIKCHHSLHTNPEMQTLKQSPVQTFKVKRLHAHDPFFSHTIDATTKSAPKGLFFVCLSAWSFDTVND